MALKKPTTVPTAIISPQLVLHEISNDQLKHRIIVIDADGSSPGKWFRTDEIAVMDEYLANIGISGLPEGIFTVSEISFKSVES